MASLNKQPSMQTMAHSTTSEQTAPQYFSLPSNPTYGFVGIGVMGYGYGEESPRQDPCRHEIPALRDQRGEEGSIHQRVWRTG